MRNNTVYRLAQDARDAYFAKMTGQPQYLMPEFEDYVFAVSEEAKELRKTGNYRQDSRLPEDVTLRNWRYKLMCTMPRIKQ